MTMPVHQSAGGLIVRAAEAQDMARVAEIYGAAVLHGTATFELEPPGAEEMGRRWSRLVENGYPFLVGQLGQRVTGYAYAGPYRERPAYRHTVEDSVYIDPGCFGQGVGRALLGQLIALAEAQGFRQMIAIIGDSRHGASINLHRTLGFTFAGTLHGVGHKHGRWLDTILMQRTLGSGEATPPPVEANQP